MKQQFQKLSDLGAREFEHIDGSLIDHLKGTMQLLKSWGATQELQDAGLFHAVYGTAGFDEAMVSLERRKSIADVIGEKAESITYEYCACDRPKFFSEFGNNNKPKFRNRFTGDEYYLSDEMLNMFCELTAANEIEIAIGNSEFKTEHGAALSDLFSKMAPYLSERASVAAQFEFADKG